MKIPDHIETTKGAMMNGDSLPSPNVELIYEMRATRSMVDKGIQFTPECLDETATCTNTTETQLNRNISSPGRNVSVRRSADQEEAIESAGEPTEVLQPQAKVAMETAEQIESDPDKVDSKWPTLEADRQQDDGCGVRCLSYTVQCCDCVIL